MLPALAPAASPVCLRATGLLPLALVGEGEETQFERLPYRLYGMYLAVLSARSAVEEAAVLGGDAASTVFGPAQGRGPDFRRGYGWEHLVHVRRGTPCYCRRARWRGGRGSVALGEALVHWAPPRDLC